MKTVLPRVLLVLTLALSIQAFQPGESHAEVTFTATELLGRPTDHSVTVNVLPGAVVEYYFEYGTTSGSLDQALPASGFETSTLDVPIEVVIDALASNTRYFYRMVYREPGDTVWIERADRTFHTARPPGSTFKFLLQSDSHMVGLTFGQTEFFENTLANEAAEGADFILDLGDTLGGDDTANASEAVANNLLLRSFFDQVGHSTPLFLVLGNHEGESGWIKGNSPPNNYAIWSTNTRKTYYPNPVPDDFYSGSTVVHPHIDGDGLRESYYAWEWGDAQFVVIDPYWYASGFAPTDIWDWSLGQEQYEWLVETLRGSDATFKFVFTHQVIGTQSVGRGGIEYMGGEWSADSATFAANRPGWAYDISIHDLMVENDVSVLFHGHDHFYALEDLDDVYYQLIPFPSKSSNANSTHYPDAIELIGSGGHLRVSVSPAAATVEYVRSDPGGSSNGTVEHLYTVEGTPGASLPGSTGWLVVGKEAGAIRLVWGADCGEGDAYNVYRGDLAVGYGSLILDACGIAGLETTVSQGSPAGEFFLVVPSLAGSEGSYGEDSGGPRARPATACGPQGSLDSCAP